MTERVEISGGKQIISERMKVETVKELVEREE